MVQGRDARDDEGGGGKSRVGCTLSQMIGRWIGCKV